MKTTTPQTFARSSRLQRAMTLLELMVAVSLLMIIVLGLYSMFDRTQLAMRQGVAQVDVMEGGRTMLEALSREIEQIHPTYIPSAHNFFCDTNPIALIPLSMAVPAVTNRTTDLQGFYFFTKSSDWSFIGYRVDYTSSNYADTVLLTNGIGTLKRFEYRIPLLQMTSNTVDRVVSSFLTYDPNNETNFSRIADGIVHFRVRAVDRWGAYDPFPHVDYYTNAFIPSAIELELGVLEPQVVGEARLMGPVPMRTYLTNQAGHMHVFRKRIPIRTVQ